MTISLIAIENKKGELENLWKIRDNGKTFWHPDPRDLSRKLTAAGKITKFELNNKKIMVLLQVPEE